MIEQIIEDYQNSHKRLLILDYDGTLVDFKSLPRLARPTRKLLQLLAELAAEPSNTVVVVSGRDCQSLDDWLGGLSISLVAEHGAFVKLSGQKWLQVTAVTPDWKNYVRPLMEASTKTIARSFIEEKSSSLAWHYRRAEVAPAELESAKLKRRLTPLVKQLGLALLPVSRALEVRPGDIDKGKLLSMWLDSGQFDFVLIAGDDTTDEDMFKVVPRGGFTIKVGEGRSRARFRLAGPAEFVKLLRKLSH